MGKNDGSMKFWIDFWKLNRIMFCVKSEMFKELLFIFVVISMSVVMPIVLTNAPTIPMDLINRVFHEYLEIVIV